MMKRYEYVVGDPVKKSSGYLWPGVVVSRFRTLRGENRYVVECTVPEGAGALRIFSEAQLESRPYDWEDEQ